MTKIYIHTKGYLFPQKWNELTKEQLLYIAGVFSLQYNKDEAVILLIHLFTGMSLAKLNTINPLVFVEIEKHIKFLFQEVKLTKQLLPTVRPRLKKFYGPEEGLANMNYEQFIMFAETYYIEYLKTQNEKYLNLFLASLYTKKRNVFDENKLDQNAKELSKLNTSEKTAILMFYQGNKNYLATKFQQLFPKGKTKQGNKEEYNFLEIIELLNNEDVSKNNTIRKTNIYEIFTRLKNLYKKNERRRTN